MGKMRKFFRRIRKSSKVKRITSTIVGGAIGFVVGGPAGAIVGATASLACSHQHDGLAVSVAIPTSHPSIPKSQPKIGQLPNVDRDIPHFPSIRHIQEPEIVKQPSISTMIADNDESRHPNWLRTVGRIIEATTAAYQEIDELTAGPSGPRHEISAQDSAELTSLKTRANNLLDDVETNAGQNPVIDCINGAELIRIKRKIDDITVTCCPVCDGRRTVDDGSTSCPSCYGIGYTTN